jgi:hypothetical protein
MSPNYYNLNRSSGAALPMLTEVTFRPHSIYCYSFTAVIRDGCAERGVSFSQVVRLIASISHVGNIDDFTIQPIEQYSYLLSGFSRHASSSTTAGAGRDHVDTTRTRPQEGRAVDTRALALRRSEMSSSDDDENGLSDSDPESGSNGDRCSSEDELGRSGTRKHSRWDPIDDQRLLAYKKEGKSWPWIFKKFRGRIPAATRTHWNMIRPRDE